MKSLSLLIKPASSACNLKCKYCFYHDVVNNRTIKNYGMMTYETIDIIIKKSLEINPSQITFAFQGGEPTLIGLDFYQHLVEEVKNQNTKNIPINYAIQTNGTLINDEFAKFLGENNFLVGISIDGTKITHDYNRIDANNKGTFNTCMKTINLLNNYDVAYNILSVVTKSFAKHITQVYNVYKKNKFKYLQFIPCIDDFGTNTQKAYSLKPKEYGTFLCELFDLWYQDYVLGNFISIRYYDNLIQMLLGYPPESCDMNGFCSVAPVFESDGSAYPCDFYVLDEWKLGNIHTSSFEELIMSDNAKKFIVSSRSIAEECKKCEYNFICRTGCRRHKQMVDDKLDKNYYCESYKMFFDYSIERLKKIAINISKTYLN